MLRTPRHGDASRRDLEILQWLGQRRGEVAAWVALDSCDLLRWPSASRLEGHTVQVCPDVGLGPNDVKTALNALGCPADMIGAPVGTAASSVVMHSQSRTTDDGVDDLSAAFRTAGAWDEELSGKMTDFLKAFGQKPPEQPQKGASSIRRADN